MQSTDPHAANGKSHSSGTPDELIPDRDMLVRFVDVMFRNANKCGFVSFRVFRDNGRSEQAILKPAYRLDDYEFVPLMLIPARQAANWYEPAVFCPPVCSFKDHRNAKTDNILEGVALSVDCDQAPYNGRITLEAVLGSATIVSESGGEWTNDQTGEVENKAHLHWRLKKPAATVEEQAMLYEARWLATKLIGSDSTAIPIVHPLRWPGSWHCKKKPPKLARIAAISEATEIDLAEALASLRQAAEAAGIGQPGQTNGAAGGAAGGPGGAREASNHSLVASTLAVIPNDSGLRDAKTGVFVHDWNYWNTVGMTIWASTSGSEDGRRAFHEWSTKAKKYDKTETDARWDHYFRSPPNRLGFGSLVYRARQADPNWHYGHTVDAAVQEALRSFIDQLLREHNDPDDNDDDDVGNTDPGGSGASPNTSNGAGPSHGAGAGSGGAGSGGSGGPASPGASPGPGAGAGAAGPGSNSMNKLPFHAEVAEELLFRMSMRDEELRVVPDERGRRHTWVYSKGLWSLLAEPGDWLDHHIEMTLRAMGCSSVSRAKFIAEARKYIERSPSVRSKDTVAWDNHGKVPTRSGLVDPITLKCEPYKKEHYATWRIDVDYDPKAVCPYWEEMLGDYFPGYGSDEREQRVVLLQDFAGTMLVDRLPKALKRALVPYGPSDTGKSSLLRALWRLFVDKPISIAIANISKTHGLEEFTRRAPWVLDEAFNATGWHVSDQAKSIVSGDPMSIDTKFEKKITMRICAPCIWATNHSVKFKENTDAIVNRLLILPLKRIFDKDRPVGIAVKAKAINPAWEPDDLIHDREKAGLLNWMLIGLKRLLERGNFVNTAEGLAALDEMKLDANPVAGFLRDCVSYNPDLMMSTVDFNAAFTGWWEETHGDKKAAMDPRWVGRNLTALANPWIVQDNQAFKEEDGKRFYLGIALNKAGRAFFEVERSKESRGHTSTFRRMSDSGDKANQHIPDKWFDHPKVVELQMNGPPAPGSE